MRTNEEIDHYVHNVSAIGETDEGNGRDGTRFAVDICSTIYGDPYLCSTGWLPDQQTAEDIAAFLIDRLREHEDDEVWACITSEARKPWPGSTTEFDGDPVHEEMFHGDTWLVTCYEMNLMSDDQRERIMALLPILHAAEKRLTSDSGV